MHVPAVAAIRVAIYDIYKPYSLVTLLPLHIELMIDPIGVFPSEGVKVKIRHYNAVAYCRNMQFSAGTYDRRLR